MTDIMEKFGAVAFYETHQSNRVMYLPCALPATDSVMTFFAGEKDANQEFNSDHWLKFELPPEMDNTPLAHIHQAAMDAIGRILADRNKTGLWTVTHFPQAGSYLWYTVKMF